MIAPIGGRYDLYGIWQPVQVISVPGVSIADVFVMPSVRRHQLVARITLRNDGAAAQAVVLRDQVLDANTTAVSFPDRAVTIGGASEIQVDVTVPWTDPRLWSPSDPYLYHLDTTLDAGGVLDQVKTRFGFRQLWAEGDKCYLNGTRITLLATSTWPQATFQARSEIQKVLSDVKAGHNVAMRLHTQPWDGSGMTWRMRSV